MAFSDQAKACPHCGRPSARARAASASQLNKISFVIGGVAVLVWLAGLPDLAGLLIIIAVVLSIIYHVQK
jgi:hypothetical protein